jgi:DNA-binding NarL/FixJ family response regulator
MTPSAPGGLRASDLPPDACRRPCRRSRAIALICAVVDIDRLNIRPCEIVQCVRCGDSNAQIAERLGISVSTVKYHLRRLATLAPGANDA